VKDGTILRLFIQTWGRGQPVRQSKESTMILAIAPLIVAGLPEPNRTEIPAETDLYQSMERRCPLAKRQKKWESVNLAFAGGFWLTARQQRRKWSMHENLL
jgi:hypothetical protein